MNYFIYFLLGVSTLTNAFAQDNPAPDAWLVDAMDETLKSQMRSYGPVVVKKLTVNITIDTAGFFDVEENYDVFFNDERRGILRFLELDYLLDIRSDENPEKEMSELATEILFPAKTTRRIAIEDINVPGHNFDVSGNHILSSRLEIKIGDEDNYLSGLQQYTIKYRVKNAFLFQVSSVDFYWNFLGGNWDMKFLEVDFNISLQGDVELDSTNYYLYGGELGSSIPMQGLTFTNNTLSGKSPIVLDENNDLTLLLHLPANYVPRPTDSTIFWSQYAWPILPAFCVLVFVAFWLFIGRDKRIVKQVLFHPPNNIDPALAGFLIDSKSHSRDLVALLPYWASKGILKMEEEEVKQNSVGRIIGLFFIFLLAASIVSTIIVLTNFLINENEIGFFLIPLVFILLIFGSQIFKAIRNFVRKKHDLTIIKLGDLPDFSKDYEQTIFGGLFRGRKKVSLSDLKNTFFTSLNTAKTELTEAGLKHGFTENSERNVNRTQVILIFTLILGAVSLYIIYGIAASVIHSLVCILLLSFSKVMDKRSSKGDELLHQVIGFRMFIEKAEKHKIEFLLKEDPHYFGKTIAYAVAFGMAEKWCKKFNGLVPPPDWYKTTHREDIAFHHSMTNMVKTATVTMSVSPGGSSGSDSSSGGGSSGGGFGGGGGSSW